MKCSRPIAGLLATSRVANLPSVVCNVWVGVALASLNGIFVGWLEFVGMAIAGVMLCLGGNFLNDWADVMWDRQFRAERALPRGDFSRSVFGWIAIGFFLLGCVLAFAVSSASGWVAVAIIISILAYTYWHKRSPWAVLAMGTCRGLLPIMGAAAVWPAAVFSAAAALLCYIAMLSWSARREASGGVGKHPLFGFGVVILLTLFCQRFDFADMMIWLIAVVVFGGWLLCARKNLSHSISRYVASLLAGIPWVDGMILWPLAWHTMHQENIPLALVLCCWMMPAAAWSLACLFQRIAPAT